MSGSGNDRTPAMSKTLIPWLQKRRARLTRRMRAGLGFALLLLALPLHAEEAPFQPQPARAATKAEFREIAKSVAAEKGVPFELRTP